jgi:hypothetical protein
LQLQPSQGSNSVNTSYDVGLYDIDLFDADKAAFVAEYLATYVTDQSARDAMCADSRSRSLRTLVLPLDLDDSLRFSCDP